MTRPYRLAFSISTTCIGNSNALCEGKSVQFLHIRGNCVACTEKERKKAIKSIPTLNNFPPTVRGSLSVQVVLACGERILSISVYFLCTGKKAMSSSLTRSCGRSSPINFQPLNLSSLHFFAVASSTTQNRNLLTESFRSSSESLHHFATMS